MCRGVMNLSCHQCSSAGTDTALEALLAFFAAFSLSSLLLTHLLPALSGNLRRKPVHWACAVGTLVAGKEFINDSAGL